MARHKILQLTKLLKSLKYARRPQVFSRFLVMSNYLLGRFEMLVLLRTMKSICSSGTLEPEKMQTRYHWCYGLQVKSNC